VAEVVLDGRNVVLEHTAAFSKGYVANGSETVESLNSLATTQQSQSLDLNLIQVLNAYNSALSTRVQ
jgi:hypothetical protein